jgi:hypothetical protein
MLATTNIVLSADLQQAVKMSIKGVFSIIGIHLMIRAPQAKRDHISISEGLMDSHLLCSRYAGIDLYEHPNRGSGNIFKPPSSDNPYQKNKALSDDGDALFTKDYQRIDKREIDCPLSLILKNEDQHL